MKQIVKEMGIEKKRRTEKGTRKWYREWKWEKKEARVKNKEEKI